MSTNQLFHKISGQGAPLLILHGLFGSSDNWQQIVKNLTTQFTVITPDLRNHGQSFWSEQFTYQAMAEDVAALLDTLQIGQEVAIVGHSMGGKVAMLLAAQYSNLLQKLVVVDIAPRYYAIHHQTILAALNSLPLAQLQSRQEADNFLAQTLEEITLRQFLLKNLYRKEDQSFAWRINLPVLTAQIENVGQALPAELFGQFAKPTLFIRGEQSNYIQEADQASIVSAFPKATIHTIAQAGHWVHAEKPQAFVQALVDFVR